MQSVSGVIGVVYETAFVEQALTWGKCLEDKYKWKTGDYVCVFERERERERVRDNEDSRKD